MRNLSRVLLLGLSLGVLAGCAGQASENSASDTAKLQKEAAVGQIYELQAAFHRAKTDQDINLMMSLWDPVGKLTVQGNPQSPFIGTAALRAYWLGSGSFTHVRFSLVPSFKTKIAVTGDSGTLYFECHDVADFDKDTRSIVNDTFLAGTVHQSQSGWVFLNMTAGKALPLSSDPYYSP